MTTDFRALCVELTDCLEKADWPLRHRYVFRQWIDIARAALADEPAVPEGREPAAVTGQPSDEELLDLHDWMADEWAANHDAELPLSQYARAVLARWGRQPAPPADGEVAELAAALRNDAINCTCSTLTSADLRRAAELLQRQAPQPPADGEVAELVAWLREQLHVCLQAPWTPGIKHFGRAAELLERLIPPQPVPVSERPWEREGWCDAEGKCWIRGKVEGDWRLINPTNSGVPNLKYCFTHCLPAHALPLPEVGE